MENEKMIKVVLLEPGKLARAVEIDASLAGMQPAIPANTLCPSSGQRRRIRASLKTALRFRSAVDASAS